MPSPQPFRSRKILRAILLRSASQARRAALLLAALWYGVLASGGAVEALARAALGAPVRIGFPCASHACCCRTLEACLTRCCCSSGDDERPAPSYATPLLLDERCSGGSSGEATAGLIHLGLHLPAAAEERGEADSPSTLLLLDGPAPGSAAPRVPEEVPRGVLRPSTCIV
jgi:hypothetical protein